MKKRLLRSFAICSLMALSNCSGSDDTSPEPINERHYLSLISYNYDVSGLFFIKNDDYEHPIKTCALYTSTVEVGDVIKICGETNIISDDVTVTAVVKKGTEIIKTVNFKRSTSYTNHPLNVNGLCDEPNVTLATNNARLWKDNTNAFSFTVEQ